MFNDLVYCLFYLINLYCPFPAVVFSNKAVCFGGVLFVCVKAVGNSCQRGSVPLMCYFFDSFANVSSCSICWESGWGTVKIRLNCEAGAQTRLPVGL